MMGLTRVVEAAFALKKGRNRSMRLTKKEKVSYGLGAVGKDMVYMLSANYILYYYQDIMGWECFAMGVILMAARIFDAFNDLIMGVVVAKTKTRWGKFRPWLLIGTVMNAIILYLMSDSRLHSMVVDWLPMQQCSMYSGVLRIQ